MNRCYLSAPALVNAMGNGGDEISERLFAGDCSGMVLEQGWIPGVRARVGRVRTELSCLPEAFLRWDCRNNRLLLRAVDQIAGDIEALRTRYGPQRLAVILGTSTSGIAEGEDAIRGQRDTGGLPQRFDYAQQEIGAVAPFLAHYLGIEGPAWTVSTACTSSAKVFVSARNLIRQGYCDAALVGGVDTLCRLTINGFAALESTSEELTNPMSRNRKGINIGEGAALFILSRQESAVEFLGAGESSDAYHISAPDPSGYGAELAMRAALGEAGLEATEIDYLNLHATATRKNDEMESQAVARVFPHGVAVSGTKPMTGHLLGAAGATELAFCCLALTSKDGLLPPHVWDGDRDPALPALQLVTAGQTFRRRSSRACMSNSFAFGGNNISLIVGDTR